MNRTALKLAKQLAFCMETCNIGDAGRNGCDSLEDTVSLREAVAKNDRPLTPSDQRIVQILMRDLRNSVFMPAASIASEAGVHESTVVRLAQKLGFAGYADLRDAIRADIQEMDKSTARLVQLTKTRGYDLDTLIAAEAETLQHLTDHVSQRDLDEAAEILLAAGDVFIYGNHFTQPLIAFLDRRLRLAGFRTAPIYVEGRNLAEHASVMHKEDVLFAFALRREPPGLNALLAHTESIGAKSVVLTDVHGLRLTPAPTKLLIAPRGVDQDFRTQVVPHLVSYALVLSLNRLAPDRVENGYLAVDEIETAIGSSPTRSR